MDCLELVMSIFMVVAVISSPLVAFRISRRYWQADCHRQRQQDVLYDLVRGRPALSDAPTGRARSETADIMERALNAIPVVFAGVAKIADAFDEFYNAKVANRDGTTVNELLTTLLVAICHHMGYKDATANEVRRVLTLG